MKIMKLSDIIIPNAFEESIPSETKMEECRYNWRMYGKQDRYIVVNYNNILIDGYIMYKILMEHKEEYAEVVISPYRNKELACKNIVIPKYRENSTTYIYGTHPNSKDTKTYMWRVPESWIGWTNNIQIGDSIWCVTKYGCAPVIINKIETLDKCPVNFRVRKVANKQIRRDNKIVEW